MEPGANRPQKIPEKDRLSKLHPAIEITPDDERLYGYLKNVYFGPDLTSTSSSYPVHQPGNNGSFVPTEYKYSNRNLNSVKKQRKFELFQSSNYAKRKYSVYSTKLQFYSSIPIFRMDLRDALDKANKEKGIVFYKDPADNPTNTSFGIAWINKVSPFFLDNNNNNDDDEDDPYGYNDELHKTIYAHMFNMYVRNPKSDFSQLLYQHNSENNHVGYRMQEKDRELSKNLFKNLLRLSLEKGRTAGVITYLSGGNRLSKRTRRAKKRSHRTRKN